MNTYLIYDKTTGLIQFRVRCKPEDILRQTQPENCAWLLAQDPQVSERTHRVRVDGDVVYAEALPPPVVPAS